MKLRVWHIPQIPGKPFHVYVKSPEEAANIIEILADYDLFQFDHDIKPDYSNMSGLEYYDEIEVDWLEWHNEDDYDILELRLDVDPMGHHVLIKRR